MAPHHTPFKSLAPLSWEKDIAPQPDSSSALTSLLSTTLSSAALLIDSIPTPTPPKTTNTGITSSGTGRARSHTDSAVSPSSAKFQADGPQSGEAGGSGKVAGDRVAEERSEQDKETVKKLQREWKDLKVQQGGSGNPHGIAMYKMSAKDGKGAWFARRSLHGEGGRGGFEKWEAALRREMQVTLERVKATPGKEPGTGNIRGIGAERRLERRVCEAGTMDLYHVSTRFPGPTTPRDFITLIMMPREEEKKEKESGNEPRAPRQFMIVSRPCDYPDCPPRSGFVRGTYESVEVIREVPVEKPLRRVRSSIDLSRDELKGMSSGERMGKEAVLRAAESEGEGRNVSFRDGDGADTEMAIEWLMVTRSDPGGSVPKFMVEKGTPGGIINDAGKFLQWLSSQTMDDLMKTPTSQADAVDHEQDTEATGESPTAQNAGQLSAETSAEDHFPDDEVEELEQPSAGSSGIYGMFSSALGMASSAVTSRVAAFAPSSRATDSDMSDDESDTSDASFASAEEVSTSQQDAPLSNNNNGTIETGSAGGNASTQSLNSTLSDTTSQALSREPTPASGVSHAHSHHEKELGKLQARMRKAQEKLERAQARRRAKHSNNGDASDTTIATKDLEKEDQALAKLRDKHEREVARQEEKYRRELQRLADKRAAEERKAEERRRKAAQREDKADLAMELERIRAERDVAKKEVQMLRERVGELQGQNTMLVARLGKVGVDVNALTEGK